MSGDPFANTTTVKNILQHIISPKIVSNGSGGYLSKTDLVNVHNIVFAAGASNETGSAENPFTTQSGVVTAFANSADTYFYHSRLNANSVVFATIRSPNLSAVIYSVSTTSDNIIGLVRITCNQAFSGTIGWFIAKF
jgi:hypothetical protein